MTFLFSLFTSLESSIMVSRCNGFIFHLTGIILIIIMKRKIYLIKLIRSYKASFNISCHFISNYDVETTKLISGEYRNKMVAEREWEVDNIDNRYIRLAIYCIVYHRLLRAFPLGLLFFATPWLSSFNGKLFILTNSLHPLLNGCGEDIDKYIVPLENTIICHHLSR